METSKLRRRIAWEAARLMYQRQESEYFQAKNKAARRLCRGWAKPSDLPTNAEIREQVQLFARLHEGDQRRADLQAMRLEALGMMRLLSRFRPRLIGSVLTGHIRRGSDIDLHVFSDSLAAVTHELERSGYRYDIVRKQVRKQGEARVYQHVMVEADHPFELTVYAEKLKSHVFTSSITGKAIERASVSQLEAFLRQEYPDLDLDRAVADLAEGVDRLSLFEVLLLPLENVRQDSEHHPEGDALYHSLQVFDHACDALPYDEEFLLAALLHDVGKAIDPGDHVAAGLEALGDSITDRTAWLVEHHMECHAIADGSIGWRRHRRLRESPDYATLVTLGECDRAGRQPGAHAPELEDALDYLRELRRMCT